MSQEEVVRLRGAPTSTSRTTCGTTTDAPWDCTIWEYLDKSMLQSDQRMTDRDVEMMTQIYASVGAEGMRAAARVLYLIFQDTQMARD